MTTGGSALALALEHRPRARGRDAAVIVASVALHVVGAVAAGRVSARGEAAAPRGPTEVRLEIAPAPPPPSPPPAAAAPKHEAPARHAVTRAARSVAPRAPSPAPVPQPAPAEEPVDLTGVTLTDPNGAAWAAAAGNGASRTGPVGPVGPRVTRPTTTTTGSDDNLVPLADLRQPPRPPELQDALARQYPADARRDGTAGQAQVRARVRPDGNLDRIRIVVASAPSFGDACRRVLEGSRWTPPLGRDGEPCATEIRYVCRFEVTR